MILPRAQLLIGAWGLSKAFAQSTTQLLASAPNCALPCVLDNVQEAGCNLFDMGELESCACADIPLQSSLSACVQTTCPFDDQIKAADMLTELCAAYPKESRQHEVKTAAIVCVVLTVVIVSLRSIARFIVTKRLWWDDWTILTATILLVAMSSIKIASAGLGFGMHYWNVSPGNAPTILQLFYATQMLYILIQVFAKVSILMLFSRIFTARWFTITVRCCVAFMLAHGLLFLFLVVFQCIPVNGIWDKSITSKCLDITAIGWAGAIFSIVEDVVILVLPVTEVLKLQLSLQKKVFLVIMFSIGSFACVTSMVRLKYMVTFANSVDATWDNVDIVIWSIIEVSVAIICGSLPALRPLLQKIPGLFTTVSPSVCELGPVSADSKESEKLSRRRSELLGFRQLTSENSA